MNNISFSKLTYNVSIYKSKLLKKLNISSHCYLYKDPYYNGEGNGNPLPYSCLENPMDGGAWQAAVHGVVNIQTQLSDFTFIFHFNALQKEMATHSSVLAWRIPGMEDPSGLLSMGLPESDTTEVTQQEQQPYYKFKEFLSYLLLPLVL